MKKIKDAVNHFRYKLNPKNNIWKATEKDVDNLNLIMDFVEQKQSDYTLFAKVFISYYGELLKYYKTDVFDKIPKKHLSEICSKPMNVVINEFIEKANESEIFSKYKSAMLDVKHPLTWNEKEREKAKSIFSSETKKMSFDEVSLNLENLINSIIANQN